MEVFRAKSGINLYIGLQGNIKILYSNNVFEKYHISLTVIREKCVVTKKEIEPSEEDVKAIARKVLNIALPVVMTDFDMVDCQGTHITPEHLAEHLVERKMER